MKQYYIYILASKKNGVLYIGITGDLIKRVWEHKNNVVEGFTKRYFVHKLVYFEFTVDVESAIQREKQLKRWKRDWKIKLIEKQNPNWDDLYKEIINITAFAGMTQNHMNTKNNELNMPRGAWKYIVSAGAFLFLAVSCNQQAPVSAQPKNYEECVTAGGIVAGGVEQRSCAINGVIFQTGEPQQPSSTPDTSAWQIYKQKTYNFEFSYPSNYSFQDASYGFLKNRIVQLIAGKNDYPGTNYSDSAFTVSNDNFKDPKLCLVSQKDGKPLTQKKIINGITFYQDQANGAGAGNFYDTTLYRAFNQGVCTELALIIHTTNIGNYDPGTVKEFTASAEVLQKLTAIAETFKFDSVTAAVPPTSQQTVKLGEPFTLKNSEKVLFEGTSDSITLTGFYNQPCPKDVQCFWSGLDVFYELSIKGVIYRKDKVGSLTPPPPYSVSVKDSDYASYATFVVTNP